MKSKILLTSVLTISIACPSYATGISKDAKDPGCTDTVLGTATGPASLEADWSANRITLNWDGKGATVSDGASTCTYDQSFTLPTTPTRTGYNFAGWKVKSGPDQCTASSINSIDQIDNGTAYMAKSLNGRFDKASEGVTEATYGISARGEWGVTLASGGILKGMARCSTVGSGYSYKDVSHEEVTDDLGSGLYCWCQPTAYTVANEEMCTISSFSWVSDGATYNDANGCANRCARDCANYALGDGGFRAALFGLVAN